MKSIPLRSFLREPAKVKRLTRSGQSVQVTDNGNPLWVIQPAAQEEDEECARTIDAMHPREETAASFYNPSIATCTGEESV